MVGSPNFNTSAEMNSSTIDALSSTKKGNLVYDKDWFEDGRTEEVIAYCSSPPGISLDLLTSAFGKLGFSPDGSADRRREREPPRGGRRRDEAVDEIQGDHSYAKRSKTPEPSTSHHQQSSRVELAIEECEREWDELAKDRFREKQQQLEAHLKKIQEQAEQNVALLAQQMELKQRAQVQIMREAQREIDERRERRLLHQQERHRLHLKRLDAKMKAAVLQREADEKEKQRREKERQDFLRSLGGVKSQVDEAARRIMQRLDACQHKEHLSKEAIKLKEQVQALCIHAGKIVQEATEAESFTDLDKTMRAVVEKLMQKQEEAIKGVAEAERLFQEETAKKEKEKQEKEKKEKEKAKLEEVKEVPSSSAVAAEKTSGTKGESLESSVSPEALKEYTGLEEKHAALEESIKGLLNTTDKQVKKYRFELQKAVNTPINAVSVQSGSHLLDKLQRLKDLLLGREVDMGGRRVMATKPTGLTYCKDLVAKKFVKQGDEQVSSNHESAFAFGAIAVALWQEIPEMGDLFLYHFYQRCPFLVPYHQAKRDDQSLESYYKALGYQYDSENQIEKQDKYLKRMSGFTRLYAAVIASPPLRGQSHPHGVDQGWKFLSRVMNLQPQPDITATTLFDFLEVCGHAMAEAYGKQFFKLLHTMYKHYFPKIQAVTPQGSGGPVMRLKVFLEDSLKRQRVPPPKGFLTQDFWRS